MKTSPPFLAGYLNFRITLFPLAIFIQLSLFSQPYEEIQTSDSPDSSALVSYGIAADIDNQTIFVGAPQDNTDQNEGSYLSSSGSVFVLFQDPAKYWNQIQKLTASNRQSDAGFGTSVKFDLESGMYAIIGAPGHKPIAGSTKRGSGFIFKRLSSGYWQQTAEIFPAGTWGMAGLADRVDIYDRFAIIAAAGETYQWPGGFGVDANGAAYVFERDSMGETWTETAHLFVPDSTIGNYAGRSVAIWKDYAFLGTPNEDEDEFGENTKLDAGAVYVFRRDSNGNWLLDQKIVAHNRQESNWFGAEVEIHDSTLIIGAKGHYNGRGSVYLYQLDSLNQWSFHQQLFALDATPSDAFGWNFSTGGDKLIIGAPGDDHTMGPDQGSIYIFEKQSSGYWSQIQKIYERLAGVDHRFGTVGLAIDGESALAAMIGGAGGGGLYHYEVCAANHELIKVQACEPMDYYGHWLDSTGLYENLALEVDWNCDSLTADVQFDLIEVDTAVVRQGDSLVAMAVGAEFQWIRCGQGWPELPGETDSVFVPDTLGFYAVLVDQSGCQEQSGCFFWAPPLVSAEVPLTSRLRLYPNPSTGKATLDLSALSQPADLRIYDARGRWLGSLERLRGSVEVDLREFANGPGLYLIQVQAGGEMGMMKMVWE